MAGRSALPVDLGQHQHATVRGQTAGVESDLDPAMHDWRNPVAKITITPRGGTHASNDRRDGSETIALLWWPKYRGVSGI